MRKVFGIVTTAIILSSLCFSVIAQIIPANTLSSECFESDGTNFQFDLVPEVLETAGNADSPADLFCKNTFLGGRIASVRSVAENAIAVDLLSSVSFEVWVGLFDDDDITLGANAFNPLRFKFVDGFRDTTFIENQGEGTAWRPGRPSNEIEKCVRYQTDNIWNDALCSRSLRVLCRSDCRQFPTMNPTENPTVDPIPQPTTEPSEKPTVSPTMNPTFSPSIFFSESPTLDPTKNPTTSESSSDDDNNDNDFTTINFLALAVLTTATCLLFVVLALLVYSKKQVQDLKGNRNSVGAQMASLTTEVDVHVF